MKRTMVLILTVFLVVLMNPASGAQKAQRQKSATKNASPKIFTWTIKIDDEVPGKAPDGSEYKLHMKFTAIHKGVNQFGEYKGGSTLSSVGQKAGVGALLDLEVKNISITLSPSTGPDSPLAPLTPPNAAPPIEPFKISGDLDYKLKGLATSVTGTDPALTKMTFKFPYALSTSEGEALPQLGAQRAVTMEITVAGTRKAKFAGWIQYQ